MEVKSQIQIDNCMLLTQLKLKSVFTWKLNLDWPIF